MMRVDRVNWTRATLRRLCLLVGLALLSGLLGGTPAAAQTQAQPPQDLPTFSAASAIVVNLTSGQVLLSRQPHDRLAIASLTKVMTAVVALRYGTLADEVVVEGRDLPGEASIGLKVGDRLTLETLLYGMMMRSGNDAASAVARSVGEKVAAQHGLTGGGTAVFVDLMNRYAASLGMSNTQFVNPHGLDAPGQFSTTYDLALLTRHALTNPTFQTIFQSRAYTFRTTRWTNVNRLLYQYDGLIGGKTGIESQSGLCLIEVAERGSQRIATVVLNAPQWYDDATKLLDYGFSDSRQPGASGLVPFGAPSPLTGPASPPLVALPVGVEPIPRPTPTTQGAPAPEPPPSTAGGGIETTEPAIQDARVRPQASEGDGQLLSLGLTVLGLLVAAVIVFIALRVLALGPFSPSGRLGNRRIPPSWQTSPFSSHRRSLDSARGSAASTTEAPAAEMTDSSGASAVETDEVAASTQSVEHSAATHEPSRVSPPARSAASATDELAAAHLAVAMRYLHEGRHEAAESALIKAIQVAPDFRFSTLPALWSMGPEGYVVLAQAYLRCSRVIDARSIVAIGLIDFADHAGLNALDEHLQAERRRTRDGSPDPERQSHQG